jgi:uncharacterized iron-regulated membrane protein
MSATRLWWQVHQWAGLKLTLLLSFVLLTGTLAVLAHEIDWLLRPTMRVDPATVTRPDVDWSAVARTVAQREPRSRIITLSAPIDPWYAAVAVVERPIASGETRTRFVYLHPTTGEYLGDGHWVSVQRVLRNLHRHLMLPTKYGVPLVSSLAIVLLATFVTSFIIYKRWWLGFFKLLRFERPRRAWGDAHRLAGVWSLPFLLLIILTGLWYLMESLGGAAPRIGAPPRHGIAPTTSQAVALLPRSIVAAREAFPGLRLERIVFPTSSAAEFKFEGQYRALLVRERANAVSTDPASATVLSVVDGRDLSIHQRISEMADPLHFGDFAGLWSKAIWFLFGLLLTGLAVSGAVIYALRIFAARGSAAARAPTPPSILHRVWLGMGVLRWPCAALVLLGVALVPSLWQQ